MDEKLFELIGNLISTGGNTAIWVVCIIYGTTLLKSLAWLVGLLAIAKVIGSSIIRSTQICKES